VYAVRTSLLKVLDEGLITNMRRRERADAYQKAYEKVMPGFTAVYNGFDSIAEKIGETATTAMVHSALGTLNPTKALLDMISAILNNSIQDTDFISNLTTKQAYDYFRSFLEKVDKLAPRYGATRMYEIARTILQEWDVENRRMQGLYRFLLGAPETLLFSAHASDGTHLSLIFSSHLSLILGESQEEYAKIQDVDYGNFAILLESIRQQLTQGIGLLCPFWTYGLGCCSSDNKDFLANVWSCTKPDRSCRLWKRMGCLATDGRTH
jgi:hypothetical protein